MVKKATLIMIICMLIASVCLFVSCKEEPPAAPEKKTSDLEPVENELGTVSDNLLDNGTFDVDNDFAPVSDEDATVSHVVGLGVGGSNAISVVTTETYGSINVDFTEFYGRGKSYYVEASFKNNGTVGKADMDAHLDITVVSGAVQDAVDSHDDWDGYYDCPDIYEGGPLSDDDALEIFEMTTESGGATISDSEWVTVSCIIDAETIDKLLTDTTDKYGSGDPTIYKLMAVFYVGHDGALNGYSYLVDNIVIKDLNSELTREGKTYEVPEEDE